jgi:phosphomannomutase
MISYLFDIDGTLTDPRQKISPEFEEFFFNWMQDRKVFLVTGSDMAKVREQLSERIIDACSGIFCSMANEFYVGSKEIYKNKLHLPEGFLFWLTQQFEKSEYPVKRTNNFEHRSGMLNFSIAGRDSTVQERNAYYEYDKLVGERERIARQINEMYPGKLEACVGGQISIDIFPVGWDKTYCLQFLQGKYKNIYFFGDKTDPGGNDYEIYSDPRVVSFSVKKYTETISLLSKYY